MNERGELLSNLLVKIYGCLKRRETFELSDVKPKRMPRNTARTFLRDLRKAGALEMVERGKYAPTGKLRKKARDRLR